MPWRKTLVVTEEDQRLEVRESGDAQGVLDRGGMQRCGDQPQDRLQVAGALSRERGEWT